MTQSIHQSLILNVLQQVSPDRLQRAVNAVVENAASITLTRTTDTEIRALVRNGEGQEYGVTLTGTGIFCSCRDALFVVKHVSMPQYSPSQCAYFTKGKGEHPDDSLDVTGGYGALWCAASSTLLEMALLAGDGLAGEL